MKTQIYFIAIMLVAISLCSCTKNDNDTGQSPQASPRQPANVQENEQVSGFKVVPVPNQSQLVLRMDEIEQILKKAGFSDLQIQQYGTSILDGLANAGAVRILIDDKVEAGFAVRGDEVFVSSRSKGYFVYNIKTGWVNTQKR